MTTSHKLNGPKFHKGSNEYVGRCDCGRWEIWAPKTPDAEGYIITEHGRHAARRKGKK